MPGAADDDPVVLAHSQTRAAGHADRRRAARAGPPGAGRAAPARRRPRATGWRRTRPNIPETFVLLLATASLGAVFSSCAPEFGTRSVIDRWQQIEPTVLVAVDGYRYGDKPVDRRAEVAAIRAGAAVAARTPCSIGYLDPTARARGRAELGRAGRADRRAADVRAGAVRPPAVRALLLGHHRAAQADRARPRRHPAGAPEDARAAPRPRPGRPVLLVHHHRLDDVELPGLRPGGRRGDRAVRRQPGATRTCGALWRLAGGDRHDLLRHLARRSCWPAARPGWCPGRSPTCRALRGVGSTGAPLPPRASAGCTRRSATTVQLQSLSGGTDVCTGFVGGVAAAAGVRRRDRLPVPGRQGRGVRRRPARRSSASSASW